MLQNKTMKLIIVYSIVAFVLLNIRASCKKISCCHYPTPIIGHYIWSYMHATSDAFSLISNASFQADPLKVQTIDEFLMGIDMSYDFNPMVDSFYPYKNDYTYKSVAIPSYRYANYNALAKIYGDTSYNLGGFIGAAGFITSPCLIDTVSNILVTCDKHYDGAHPAGSSLNDIIRVVYNTPKPVLQNGAIISSTDPKLIEVQQQILYRDIYKNTTLDSFNNSIDSNYLIGMKNLGLQRNDFGKYISEGGIVFLFTAAPARTDIYKFKVVMKLKNGMVYTFPQSSGWSGIVHLQGSE